MRSSVTALLVALTTIDVACSLLVPVATEVDSGGSDADADGDPDGASDADEGGDSGADASDADADSEGAGSACGDGTCRGAESCVTCWRDCGECVEGCEPPFWDVGAGFSPTQNPGGAWTYGWTESDGRGFALGTRRSDAGIDEWAGGRAADGAPTIGHNGTEGAITVNTVIWEPGETMLHPGPADERAVLRWTAPTEGSYSVHARFYSSQTGATDVHVLLDGVSMHDAALDFDWSLSSFDEVLVMDTGATVDLTVGYGSDLGYEADWTGLTAAVARTDWDIARDFSAECNPTGAWSYGSTDALGEFVPFPLSSRSRCWSTVPDSDDPTLYAHLWKNVTPSETWGIQPGEVSLHPGCFGDTRRCGTEWAVARWTSSFSGALSITGSFGALSPESATPDLDIARTGAGGTSVLWHRENTARTEPFDLTTPVEAGDFIDFVVGDAYWGGNTPLDLSITRIDAVH